MGKINSVCELSEEGKVNEHKTALCEQLFELCHKRDVLEIQIQAINDELEKTTQK